MRIELDDLSRPQVLALLREHLGNMHAISPPESVHALDVAQLKSPEVAFWTVWEGEVLLGCGALREIDRRHGEVKSMRTTDAHRRKGVARVLLGHIVGEARRRAYTRLSLETGSQPEFYPAQLLYASFGFARCPPFGSYVEDPNSVFMTMSLPPP
jgi:putative acetyltransferase